MFFGTVHSNGYIFPFLLCLLHLFSQLFVRPPQTTILPFCFSFLGDGLDQCLDHLITASCLPPGLLFFYVDSKHCFKILSCHFGDIHEDQSLGEEGAVFSGTWEVPFFLPFPRKGRSCEDLCWAHMYPFKLWNGSWVPCRDRSLFLVVSYSDCFRACGCEEYGAPALTSSW